MKALRNNEAFGKPGIEARWTHSNKSGVGTAFSSSSHLWFTVWDGIVTEVYYPTVDRPQIRDLEYLVTDGKTFFHEEKRDLTVKMERLSNHALGYRCINADPKGKYSIEKQIISNPESACLIQHTRVTSGDPKFLSGLKLYALCAPHLEVGGAGNNGYLAKGNGHTVLMAQKQGRWLAMGATVPFSRVSCGYVGKSDGWTDLHENFEMDWQFESASDGNIALTGEIDLAHNTEFTLGLAFGDSEHRAIANLLQSLGRPFEKHLKDYIAGWDGVAGQMGPLAAKSLDKGNLYNSSYSVLLAHEDKAFAGALVASLSIPWGEVKGDGDQGGYHLVWTRDMVNSAGALLAAGEKEVPFRALIYLAVAQNSDGGFAQNFWVTGDAYWKGVQLDETAFPLMLAFRLYREKALQDFDPLNFVHGGVSYLIRNGPVTQEERWEEAAGYSPSHSPRSSPLSSAPLCSFTTMGITRALPSLKNTQIILKVISKTGPSPRQGRWSTAYRPITCAFFQSGSASTIPAKTRNPESSTLQTSHRENKAIIQPATWSMEDFWSWCVMEFAVTMIRPCSLR